MTHVLALLLRIAGAGLLALALVHVPIARRLRWREDGARLTPVNAAVFRVHALFICVMLVMMALPCLLEPLVLLERSRAGAWLAWSFTGFWTIRLCCQWCVYPRELWRGQRFETFMHWCFTAVWFALAALFAACGARQCGWWP